ncbi:MAG: hypothetical protein U5R48_01545 [Gammaproteobacteria bacterium]|nr:hypothetical protein [Gammaproteobacteria bacterium]
MTMQQTPLLMSRLMDRGAALQPDVEVVTATVGRRPPPDQSRDAQSGPPAGPRVA